MKAYFTALAILGLLLTGSKPPYISTDKPDHRDSTLLEKYKKEMIDRYYKFDKKITKKERDEFLEMNQYREGIQQVIYAPDGSFKIFHVSGELCMSGFCNDVNNSYIHFNLKGKEVIKPLPILPVSDIYKLVGDKYLIIGEQIERSSTSSTVQTCASAHLISFKNNKLNIHQMPQPGRSQNKEFAFCQEYFKPDESYIYFYDEVYLLRYRFLDVYTDSMHMGDMWYENGAFFIKEDSAWHWEKPVEDQIMAPDAPIQPDVPMETDTTHKD